VKKLNSAEFVNSLAEVTQHEDRDIIERSLLQTLIEFVPTADHWLYRIVSHSAETSIALIAYTKNNTVDTLDYEIKERKLPQIFLDSINKSIETQSVQIINKTEKSDCYHFIYPAMNKKNEVFAVLIQSNKNLEFENQSLIHGLLKVYSNYLQLIDKTKRDKLTNLLNRETLDSEITRILIRNNTNNNTVLKSAPEDISDKRKTISETTYWLGLLDIDYFKNVNDSYGHLYGDDILILVARLMEKSIRDYDLLFRYGGEEFVLLIVADGMALAEKSFNRIRKEINSHHYAELDKLTVSIGVTQIGQQVDPANVIDHADKALYHAKEHGRNQVQIYEALIESGTISEQEDDFDAGEISFF